MKAVCTEDTNKHGTHSSNNQAGIYKGIGHSQDSGAQTALEQMDESFIVTAKR